MKKKSPSQIRRELGRKEERSLKKAAEPTEKVAEASESEESGPKVNTVDFQCSQCTMRLSIELENFQILKSKGLVFAQFLSKYDNSSDDWSKTGQNLKEKYSHHIFVQN